MRAINLRNLLSVTGLGLAMVSGTAVMASAQNGDQRDNRRQDQMEQLRQKRESELAKANQERIRAEQERARAEQERLRREQGSVVGGQWSDRNRGQGNNGWNNNNANNGNRFRIYRNGSYYNTDRRGADLLRQAVNAGYQQGFQAGRNDRNSRRRGSSWSNSSVYRSGTFGYQSYVDRGQYQYYFQQGFQRGYQDGYNSRNQYGNNSGGLLSSILDAILDVRRY